MISFVVSLYYVTIVGWCLTYFAAGFGTPPWEKVDECKVYEFDREHELEAYFYHSLTAKLNPATCQNDNWPRFSGAGIGGNVFTWLFIFGALFKGVETIGMLAPCNLIWSNLFIFILFLSVSTTGDDDYNGFSWYFGVSEHVEIDVNSLWADAIGQSLLSIGVCMGIYGAYGSYNPKKQPVIKSSLCIVLSNFALTLMAGLIIFWVFSHFSGPDYKEHESFPTAGPEVLFITWAFRYTKKGMHFWYTPMGMTLFFIGITSAYAMV